MDGIPPVQTGAMWGAKAGCHIGEHKMPPRSVGGLSLLIYVAWAVQLLLSAQATAAANHPPLARSPSVTLMAVGDILLDRGVARKIEQYGTGYAFAEVRPILATADIAFGNLECPLAEQGQKVVKRFSFKAKPAYAQALVEGGMTILSVANNHSMDCGRTGLVETMDTLRHNGIRWCGAGLNRSEAERPTILTVHGIRIAFVGFCDFLPEGSFLRADRPTIAFASEETVRRAVAAARPQADVVIASFHWGVEFTGRPADRQMRLAQIAVNAGADLVLGHHPHVLQGLALVSPTKGPYGAGRRSLVEYSLANFVFDQGMGLNGRDTATIILRCTLGKHGVTSARIIPVRIHNCRPYPATGADRAATLARMALYGSELNTPLRNGRVVGLGQAETGE